MTTTKLVLGACFALAGAGCDNTTTTSLQIQVQGPGIVYSDTGDIDCSGTTSGQQSGLCSFRQQVGQYDNASAQTFHLHAVPAAGGAFEGWGFVVNADCPTCDSSDPEMGAIQTNGADADVRIDMNPGYDVDDIVTVTFIPNPTKS